MVVQLVNLKECNAAGYPLRDFVLPVCDDDDFIQLGVKVEKENLCTVPDESNKIKLSELIQSYKDQCGMEFVQKQLRLGLVSPAQIADDGKHSGDGSLPTDVNDAYRASLEAKAGQDKLANALGVDLATATEDQIRERLAAILFKTDAAVPEKKEEVTDHE